MTLLFVTRKVANQCQSDVQFNFVDKGPNKYVKSLFSRRIDYEDETRELVKNFIQYYLANGKKIQTK